MSQFKLMGSTAIAALMNNQASSDDTPAEVDEAEAGPGPEEEAEEEAKKDKGDKPESGEQGEGSGSDEEVEAVSTKDAAAFAKQQRAEGHAAGFAEANTRMNAVLGSPEGKANMRDAVFMLCKTDASSTDIIAELKARGPSDDTPPQEPDADIDDTDVDLGHGTDPAKLTEASDDAPQDAWDKSIDRVNAGNGFAGSAISGSSATNAAGQITISPARKGGVGH